MKHSCLPLVLGLLAFKVFYLQPLCQSHHSLLKHGQNARLVLLLLPPRAAAPQHTPTHTNTHQTHQHTQTHLHGGLYSNRRTKITHLSSLCLTRTRLAHLKSIRAASRDASKQFPTVSNITFAGKKIYFIDFVASLGKGWRHLIDRERPSPLLIGQLVSEKAAVVLAFLPFIITVYGEQSGLENWCVCTNCKNVATTHFFIFVSFFLRALKTQTEAKTVRNTTPPKSF